MNNEDKDTFVVGCDSGGLFKCSLTSQTSAQPSKFLVTILSNGNRN